MFKPILSRPAPPLAAPEGSWAVMTPLLTLLGLLFGGVAALHLLSGVRVVGVVLGLVPLTALVWLALQTRNARALRRRAAGFVFRELPGYRAEIVLLAMAGFIGIVGASLLAPILESLGINPLSLPGWSVLVALVWLIPLAGQLGMNPILAVTLAAPLIPAPEALGVSPTALVASITAGWALSGASSPFTATTLLVGSFAQVSAAHVGVRWNGLFTVLCAAILSLWVVLLA